MPLFGPNHGIDNNFLHHIPLVACERPRLSRRPKTRTFNFSSMFPMRNTCTSYLQRHTRWSFQLGATQDEAILLRGHKNFQWPQRLYFLHLHHMSSVVRSRLVQSFTPEQSQSSMCTFLLEKKGPRLAMKESLLQSYLSSRHGSKRSESV